MFHDEGTRRRPGCRAEGHSDKVSGRFIWEQDGHGLVLDAKLLTREEGVRIVESLRPVGSRLAPPPAAPPDHPLGSRSVS